MKNTRSHKKTILWHVSINKILPHATGFALFSGLFSFSDFPQYMVHQLLLFENTVPIITTLFSSPVWLTQVVTKNIHSFHSEVEDEKE